MNSKIENSSNTLYNPKKINMQKVKALDINKLRQLQDKSQQLQAMLIQKMYSSRMQLHIIANFNNKKMENLDFVQGQDPTPTSYKMKEQQDQWEYNHPSKNSENMHTKFQSSSSTFASISSQSPSQKNINQSIKNQQSMLDHLEQTLKKQNQQRGLLLIQKQIDNEHTIQLTLKLSNYEKRIQQMLQILVRKQIDITAYQDEGYRRPRLFNLRNFTNQYIQVSNLRTMVQKIFQLGRQMNFSFVETKKISAEHPLSLTSAQVQSNPTQILQLPVINPSKTESQKENNWQQFCTNRNQSQKIGAYSDPLSKNIILILSNQQKRKQNLLTEYTQLRKLWQQLTQEATQLSSVYKKRPKN